MITKTPRDMSQGKDFDFVACIVDAGKTIETRANAQLDDLMADVKDLVNGTTKDPDCPCGLPWERCAGMACLAG